MNICQCGCGKECKSKFVRGHNKRKNLNLLDKLEEAEEEEQMINKEEVKFDYKENYTLTDVPEDAIINYEAGKKWLDKTFNNYSVMLLYNEKEIPYKIVLSAYSFLDEKKIKKVYRIGQGNTFSTALKTMLLKT